MIIIAESGSTKTDWRIINPDESIDQAKTIGFNPFHIGEDAIAEELTTNLVPKINGVPSKVFFYGAGCTSGDSKSIIINGLQNIWPNVEVEVNNDLLAAARALCLDEEGIACILGTGSNSCDYNGTQIMNNVPPLGYVLGDEGSGTYLGKILLREYLRGIMPSHIAQKIDKRFGLSIESVLNNTYKQPLPNRFLASFAKFIYQNIKEVYLYNLVYNAFSVFFENNVMLYHNYEQKKVHFTGSVAFYFSNILRQVAIDKNIMLKNVVESPIAGLTLYHQKLLIR
ncbi:MAG: N-acetylglucosamine kinase [Cyclobacteriaceae bacterium]|nr:N-acetylglucosamine kinase [Cyclobacteriaceae bacterium]